MVSTGSRALRSRMAEKGFEGCWGGWDGVLGVLMDTGREFGGVGCNWEGFECSYKAERRWGIGKRGLG